VENMLSMRYLSEGDGPAPRLQDHVPEDPKEMMERVASGVMALGRAGVVHSDLSAYNVLVQDGRPWFIDLSEAIRMDRTGEIPWIRLTEAEKALRSGLGSLNKYFQRYGVSLDQESIALQLMKGWDRFGVME
jgi:RIO kinase 1